LNECGHFFMDWQAENPLWEDKGGLSCRKKPPFPDEGLEELSAEVGL
jgi:hypothetical protein